MCVFARGRARTYVSGLMCVLTTVSLLQLARKLQGIPLVAVVLVALALAYTVTKHRGSVFMDPESDLGTPGPLCWMTVVLEDLGILPSTDEHDRSLRNNERLTVQLRD